MRMMMGEKNSRKSRKMVKILAIVLAMLMIFDPGMLAYAEEGDGTGSEAKSVISMPDEQEAPENDETPDADSTVDSESGDKAEEQDTEKESGEESDNSTESTGNDAAAKNKVPEKKDVRKALQNAEAPESDDETGDEDEGSEETITVTVRIVNETFPKSEGAPWEGTLVEKKTAVPSNYTMMQALHKVCRDSNIESRGTDGSYVSMIGGLKEFDGGGGSGWMGTLNDWLVNQGFDQMQIKDGDVISIEYTCSLGEDIGGSFTNRDKRIKSITTSVGELTPEFDSDFNEYNLMVPEGTTELSVYTTAVNKNYLVRSIVKGKEYERGAVIPISDGTHIDVKCGDPSWPSMNSYDQEDTVKPVTYRINVFEGAYDFLVDVTGDKCGIELDRESGIYYAGEVVNFSLRYNSNKYNIKEDGVKVYIGGSNKYIVPDKTGDKTYSFTMPCNDVEVKAKCETRPDWPLNVTGSLTGCTMTTDHADGKYLRDEKVTFTLKAESGKRINDLSVRAEEKDSGNTIELEHISQDKYSFTMPGEDVRIYAESEDKTANGLKGYTITTAYGNVNKQLSDASRTSICDLPERAVEFGLSLNIDKGETLTAVRIKDINGTIKTYKEPSMTGVSVGTRNTALLGKDIVVTVLTEDMSGTAHTYTIRIKTRKSEYDREHPDVEIVPVNAASSLDPVPYKKTLMTSGVTLYEADYPTRVQNFSAVSAPLYLQICPTYEENAPSIYIRCKVKNFEYIIGKGIYQTKINDPITVMPGDTLEIPIEIDFMLESGEILTRKYLYRITNGRYAKQKFKVLTKNGNPMTPTNFSIGDNAIKVSGLKFENGCFTLDFKPGKYTASSMGKTVDFTVDESLDRPYLPETVAIQTDTQEYKCTVKCSDKKAVYTITEASGGVEYFNKAEGSVFSLPPGHYVLKAYNENSHRYSRTLFVIDDKNVTVEAAAPYLTDPEYVVEELNKLEEIQAFDDGEGRLRIYLPDYQNGSIRVRPIVVDSDGMEVYTEKEDDTWYYYVDRDVKDHIMTLKYEVFNEVQYSQTEPEKFYTDVMELYVPAYSEADPGGDDPEVPDPPDVRTLNLMFGIEDGDWITGLEHTSDENDRWYFMGRWIPVLEKDNAITVEQLKKAGYRVRYTMRYARTADEELQNVGIRNYMGGEFFTVSNSLPCVVCETSYTYDQVDRLFSIDPDIGNEGFEVNGWYEVTAWFEDQAGNKSKSNTVKVYKDSEPPRATLTPDHYTGYYKEKPQDPVYSNEPITVTVNAADNGMGLHEYAYSYDKGETWVKNNTITITEPGTIDIYNIWVRDKVGNICGFSSNTFDSDMYENPTGHRYWGKQGNGKVRWGDGGGWPDDKDKSLRYFYVDTEYPAVGVTSDFDQDTDTLSLEVKASDQISGLSPEAYSFDGGETWQSSHRYSVTLGEYRADNIKVRDRAGNVTTYDDEYVWTKDSFTGTGPVIKSVKVDYGEGGGIGYDGRKWYQSAVVKIEAEAGGSEIAGYSFDGKRFTMSNKIELDKGQNFALGTIQVIDRAGNITTYDKAVDVTNIDNTAPVINIYSFKGHAVAAVREIYLSIEASDALSKGLQYAVTAIPINEYWRGYPMPDLKLEWADSFDDDQFRVSNIGKKYDRDILVTGAKASWNHSLSVGPNDWGIRMWVKDAAGNVSHYDTWTDGGYIDQEGPKITEVTTEYKRFNDESGIVKVYVAATEPKYGAGLAPKAYSFDGGKTWQASNSISIPIGASIPAGQIKVRDDFGNISTYNKVVKTTLQDVITRIKHLDPRKAKDKDFKEIIDLFNQLTDREKSKVYNWQDFLNMMGNRKDQDWDDDYGDIGDPDDGDQGDDHGHDGEDDHGDDGDDHGHNNDDHGEHGDGSGDSDGDSDSGSGNNEGTPSDGNGNGGGGTPDNGESDGGKARETVSVALSDANVQDAPDTEAEASSGQSYREAEIDKIGGGLLSHGMVKLWELMLLLIIVLGAYTYGAARKYRRYKEQI